MAAYNKVNGKYLYESPEILRNIIIDQWGFEGVITSDWFATHRMRDPSVCLNAGLHSEMPQAFAYTDQALLLEEQQGKINQIYLDDAVRRILRLIGRTTSFESKTFENRTERKTAAHRIVARRIIEEGSVLLKNSSELLPIDPQKIKSSF